MPREVSIGSSFNLSALAFGAVILLLLFAKALLIPLAFALTLSFLLLPLVSFLEHHGLKRFLSVAFAAALTGVLLLSGGYIVSRQVLNVAATLPGYRANIEAKLNSLHSSSEKSLSSAVDTLEDLSRELAPTSTSSDTKPAEVRVVGDRSDQLRDTVKLFLSILEPFGQLGIVIIFTVYTLTNREDLRHRLLLLAGMGNLNLMTRALEDATTRISRYLVLQIEVNACYGVLFGIGLHFLHIPEATLWGVIAGTLRIVPFVGSLLGMIIPLILSIAISGSWWPPVFVLSFFLLLELTTGNLVEPWLFSSRTGISELALVASAIFWSTLWGWQGLILSTPLTVCVIVVGRNVPQLRFLHSLLGTDATLSPAAHFYERLLAMDQVEAWAIANKYLETKPLVDLYDSVLIPVLSLAEEDRQKGALTDAQSSFVLLSLGELIFRLADYDKDEDSDDSHSERSRLIESHRAHLRKEFAIICVSSGNKADDLATGMLSQILDRGGHQNLMLSASALSDEILSGLASEKDTVIFVSALQPFAYSRVNPMCQQVRAGLMENRLVVGFWNSVEDNEEVLRRLRTFNVMLVTNSLSGTLKRLDIWKRGSRRAAS